MLIQPFEKKYRVSLGFCVKYPNFLRYIGLRHNGIDSVLPCNTPVLAPGKCTVYKVGYQPGLAGNYVYLKCGKLLVFLCHLSRIYVQAGKVLRQGQLVATSGTTGASTGCHLHVGVKYADNRKCDCGVWCNPTRFIRYGKNPKTFAVPKARTYVVKKGDTLWGIAVRYYRQGSKWRSIYNANRGVIKNPNQIIPGMKLIIP